MPQTQVIYYCDENGEVPVLNWLAEVGRGNQKVIEKCVARLEALAAMGHELRRPLADYLRDGIYELRVRQSKVQYRILYFFHGQNVAVVAHGLTKEKSVPAVDIDRAIERKQKFERAPEKHTFQEQ